MNSDARAPQQARSRRTMQQLLAATITIIENDGLSGVTIPEVAAAAGVSVGSVYRRFADKDALVRAAFLQVLEESQTTNQANLPIDHFRGRTLDDALRAVSRALIAQYKRRVGLLKAVDEYLQTQADESFRDCAVSGFEANLRIVIQALLPFRKQIMGRNPERKITFALLSAITVIEVHKLDDSPLWNRMLALNDDDLAAETTRAMAAYLKSK